MTIEQMIDLLNKDLMNEWMHLRFYLHHASAITGPHRQEYQELFLNEAKAEMQHVSEFSDLIYGLGGVPTTESNSFENYENLHSILSFAYKMEKEVVENYTLRIEQANALGGVNGKYLEIFLEKQIEKSREDVDNYARILKNFVD